MPVSKTIRPYLHLFNKYVSVSENRVGLSHVSKVDSLVIWRLMKNNKMKILVHLINIKESYDFIYCYKYLWNVRKR